VDYFVNVVQTYPERRIIKTLGPMSESKAEKVADGIDINLDDEFYFTEIVEDDE